MNKIIYLDAAASALKPESVVRAEMDFWGNHYANAGRGVCARVSWIDEMIARTRRAVADFINAGVDNIVFTSGATDGLNRVVSLARQLVPENIKPVVCVSDLDHHSCRLPWENFVNNGDGTIVVVPLDSQLNIDVNRVPYADIILITAMSNVVGVPQDVRAIVRAARAKNPNVVTIVDAAQYVAHGVIDVKDWDCDFLCFSGHKIGADTGVGVLYIKNPDSLAPDKFGGGMVLHVGEEKIVPNVGPEKFEAGTLPLTQIVGLENAIKYRCMNIPNHKMLEYLYDELSKIPRIKILTPRESVLLTFVVQDMLPIDFGALAGAYGLCLRVGNMCATWIHRAMGIGGSIRISVGAWNTMDEMKETVDIIKWIVK